MRKKQQPKRTADRQERKPPVHIPLPFEKAVEGLLGVDPKQPSAGDGAKKKPGKKKRG